MPFSNNATLVHSFTSPRAPRAPRIAESLETGAPPHLCWAQELIDNLLPENNVYGTSPSYILWEGVNGTHHENRTVCATFLSCLLRQGYGWTTTDLRNWLGSTSPNSSMYHDAIVTRNGFLEVPQVADVLPGDVLAIRYDEDSSASGHIAVVVSAPAPRVASSPLVPETAQFDVTVVDSTSSGHGATDSRLLLDGTFDAGAGSGVMRLYADSTGRLAGYAWSTSSGSLFYGIGSSRHMVIGRLNR